MFKLIFRTILIVFVLIVVFIALVIWKGGDSFRWIGDKTVKIGHSIERLGDLVDGIKERKKEAEKTVEKLKDKLDSKEENKQEKHGH